MAMRGEVRGCHVANHDTLRDENVLKYYGWAFVGLYVCVYMYKCENQIYYVGTTTQNGVVVHEGLSAQFSYVGTTTRSCRSSPATALPLSQNTQQNKSNYSNCAH